jgi:predicted site-specific integrase-resolvase
MNQSELIQSFAKGKATDNTKQSQRNAVIYIRVSIKEQADTNQSLETQKKYCLQYAQTRFECFGILWRDL